MKSKHVLFWILYTFFIYMIFSILTDSLQASLRTVGLVSMQILVLYLNLHVLLPKFFAQKRYFCYGLFNLLLLLLAVFIIDLLIRYTIHCDKTTSAYEYIFYTVFNYKFFNMSSLEVIFNHMMPILLAVFISFIIYTYTEQKKQKEQELLYINAEKDFLISQINPHFLFNILNNIYSLTLNDNNKGAEGIMQLSKMLDYSLYGAKKGTVSLREEINYITNFIDLFKLKDDEIEKVSFIYNQINQEVKIAPMLLIPFVENAFKHGNVEDVKNGYIDISLQTDKGVLKFICKNTYVPKKSVDESRGIGINNVKRRLKLLYDKKHQLNIEIDEGIYSVQLKIDTNDA